MIPKMVSNPGLMGKIGNDGLWRGLAASGQLGIQSSNITSSPRWCPISWAFGQDWHWWPWGSIGLRCPFRGRAKPAQANRGGKSFNHFVVCSRNFLFHLSERSCQDLGFMFLLKFYRIKGYTSCPFLFPTIPASHPDSLHYILWGDPTMGPVPSA